MKTIIVVILLSAFFGLLFYAVRGSSTAVDKQELAAECLREVKTAQEEAQEKICTQETALLSCGRDPSFIYEASNGCEKSYLEGKGWK